MDVVLFSHCIAFLILGYPGVLIYIVGVIASWRKHQFHGYGLAKNHFHVIDTQYSVFTRSDFNLVELF